MIAAALAEPGLAAMVLAAMLAGIVRGFSGFGTAMVFLPVAGQFHEPVAALTALLAMDLLGPLPNVPGAWRAADRRDLGRLGIGLSCGLPVGLGLLLVLDPSTFRYLVSCVALVLLILLVGGVRYRGPMSPPLIYATGGLGGLFGGSVGVPGPPVILLYMASLKPVSAIRANNLLYLVIADVLSIALLAVLGRLEAAPFVLGLMLTLPYMLANVAGAAMFRPGRASVYRAVAYAIIAGSALLGLPIWD